MKKNLRPLKPLIFWLIYSCVIVAAIVIDQLTKYYVEIAVAEQGRIRIIGDWLTLTWTLNDGATGGILHNLSWRNVLFFVMTLIGLPVFGYMLWRSRTRSVWGQIAFAFMIGGTIGNAIDRLFLTGEGGAFFSGAVRDFVRVEGFFGIFNMADSFLVVGVFLALFAIVVFDYDSLVASIIDERGVKVAQSGAVGINTDGKPNVVNGAVDDKKRQSVNAVDVTNDTAEKTDEDD